MIYEIFVPEWNRTWREWIGGMPNPPPHPTIRRWLITIDESFEDFIRRLNSESRKPISVTVTPDDDPRRMIVEATYHPPSGAPGPAIPPYRGAPQIKISCAPNTSSARATITDTGGNPIPGEYTHARIDIDWATGEPPKVDLVMAETRAQVDVAAQIRTIEIDGKRYKLVEDDR